VLRCNQSHSLGLGEAHVEAVRLTGLTLRDLAAGDAEDLQRLFKETGITTANQFRVKAAIKWHKEQLSSGTCVTCVYCRVLVAVGAFWRLIICLFALCVIGGVCVRVCVRVVCMCCLYESCLAEVC
jgi:hypothetical protein